MSVGLFWFNLESKIAWQFDIIYLKVSAFWIWLCNLCHVLYSSFTFSYQIDSSTFVAGISFKNTKPTTYFPKSLHVCSPCCIYVLFVLSFCCLCGPCCYLTLQPVIPSFVCIVSFCFLFFVSHIFIESIMLASRNSERLHIIIYLIKKGHDCHRERSIYVRLSVRECVWMVFVRVFY